MANPVRESIDDQMRRQAERWEAAIRSQARPLLERGYQVSELAVVQHGSWWTTDAISLEVCRKRSRLRLWWRRLLTRAGLRPSVDQFYRQLDRIIEEEPLCRR